jgi:pre-mRNA-splicing factor RBM22/SLT11
MSIFLSSLPPNATEETIKTRVVLSIPSVEPSKIRSVVHVAKSRYVLPFNLRKTSSLTMKFMAGCRCAFVNFKDRASAELAAQAWASGLDIDGTLVNVKWGRSKAARTGGDSVSSSTSSTPVAGPSSQAVDSS